MRKVLIFALIILILLTLVPAITSLIKTNESKTERDFPVESTVSPQVAKKVNKRLIISIAGELADKDFCDEAIKAIIAIVKNNVEVDSSAYNTSNQSEESDDFYKRVENLYKKTEPILIYKGEKVFVPTSSLSSGFTKTSENYPYMQSVASPWDCFHQNFVYGKDYADGVSLRGIDYLCKEGYTAKEALKWYLPEFDIK